MKSLRLRENHHQRLTVAHGWGQDDAATVTPWTPRSWTAGFPGPETGDIDDATDYFAPRRIRRAALLLVERQRSRSNSHAAAPGGQDDRGSEESRRRIRGGAWRAFGTLGGHPAQPGDDQSRAQPERLSAVQQLAAAAALGVRHPDHCARVDAAVRVERSPFTRDERRPQSGDRESRRRGPSSREDGGRRSGSLRFLHRAAPQSQRERRHLRSGAREIRRAGRGRRDRPEWLVHAGRDGAEHGADTAAGRRRARARAIPPIERFFM